ncbi:MAG TPA: EAL domain-containing protein [Steroidobacteraceae bacterium]|nr:EAL domain-containing protein [Steroidobacteraceae bacterium]
MKIESLSLRTRLGRRVFLLFVICALLPIAITSALSVIHLSSVSRDRQAQRLKEFSETYGLGILQRLEAADVAIGLIGRGGEAALAQLRRDPQLAPFILAVATAYEDGSVVTTRGTVSVPPQPHAAARTQLVTGLSWLALEPGAAAGVPAIFIVAQRPGAGADALQYFVLDPHFVFGDSTHLPYQMGLRVRALDGRTLYSVEPLTSAGEGHKNGRTQLLAGDDNTFATQAWELFLSARFASESWVIESSQPVLSFTEGDVGLREIIPWTLAAAVILVLLVSSTQIRRSLVPLDELLKGTRRIAARDFDTRVSIRSADEFEELAASFNDMSDSLRSQFTALEALSEIDRLILSSPSIESILETLLGHVHRVTGCASVSITLIDPDEGAHGRVYSHDGSKAVRRDVHRILLGRDIEPLALGKEGRLIDLQSTQPAPTYAADVAARGARWALTHPVRGPGGLTAILTLGYLEAPDQTGVERRFSRDFADRLAVALNNIEREERLYRQAHYDELTELPNRQLFKDRLAREIARSGRAGEALALLYIDLDNFKRINDTLGHDSGDELLRAVARRLSACVKQSDTVARLGGDEFLVIVGALQGPEEASKVAERILAELAAPLEIGAREYQARASIGIAIYPDDGATLEDLLKNADTAMYRAKEDGRGRATFFEPHMNARALERWSLETGLHRALQMRQFVLHYQPQFHLQSGGLSGVEALIRWGQRSPAEFIPVAEDCGLIVDIGAWVLEEACAQFRRWRSAGIQVPQIGVNVSSEQLRRAEFVDSVRDALLRNDMPPWSLELELTESVLLSNDERTATTLAALVEMGVSLALDDFGTGYSSLSYLRRYPVQVIKIDRSFVTDIPRNPDASAIAATVIAMARTLRKRTVAEGIETAAQLEYLRERGCDTGQGYLFSKAVPADELARLVTEQRSRIEETIRVTVPGRHSA